MPICGSEISAQQAEIILDEFIHRVIKERLEELDMLRYPRNELFLEKRNSI